MKTRVYLMGALLLAPFLLSIHLEAGHRNCWASRDAAEQREEAVPLTEKGFVAQLSDYYRQRYGRLSNAQRHTVFRYFETRHLTPDESVEQVAQEEHLSLR